MIIDPSIFNIFWLVVDEVVRVSDRNRVELELVSIGDKPHSKGLEIEIGQTYCVCNFFGLIMPKQKRN